MGHARLHRAVRLGHQASSSDRAGAGSSRGRTSPPRTPHRSVILRVTPAATSSSPASSPNRWAVSQSFPSFFRVNVWRQLAEHVTESLSKGDQAVVIGWLTNEPGYLRHAHTLERLSAELAEVLARLIAADQRHPTGPAPAREEAP